MYSDCDGWEGRRGFDEMNLNWHSIKEQKPVAGAIETDRPTTLGFSLFSVS